MTIKELLEMEMHEEYVFNHGIVIRVPGGWIYEIETPKDGAYPGGMTPCFVPEPSLQTIEPDYEPDYDKTLQAEKTFLTMGTFY